MKFLSTPVFIAILIISASYKSNPYLFQEDGIEFLIKEDKITVENLENRNLYYFIVNRSLLPRIFWVPNSTDDNRIRPFSGEFFLLEEIPGYSDSMNEVSFFYWRSEDPGPGEAVQIILELK
jgi:hypothetical protein